MRKAVVLLSGGIDSATCLTIAAKNHDEVIPVHFNYGQQTAELERQMTYNQCVAVAKEYDNTTIRKTPVLDYKGVFSHFAEGVAEDGKTFGHMNEEDGRSSGYVPMRNLHFIASGAAVADVEDASSVYHGAQMGDEADYPDCRPEFMDATNQAINASLPDGQGLSLRTPLIDLTKTEVLLRAEENGVAFEYTYSCYEVTDADNPDPCGDCPACVERAEAFERAGLDDPFGTPEKV